MLDIQRNDYDIIEVEIGNEPKFQEPCMHAWSHAYNLVVLKGSAHKIYAINITTKAKTITNQETL